jgi:hypothetical protein
MDDKCFFCRKEIRATQLEPSTTDQFCSMKCYFKNIDIQSQIECKGKCRYDWIDPRVYDE